MADVNVSRVPVVDKYGNFGTIDQSELANFSQSGSGRIATHDEIQDHADQQEYGEGVTNKLKAAALGAARGLTFNLSDPLLASSGSVNINTIQKLKQYQPGASLGGELAGVAAGLAIPGGEELGAADLLNPVKGVSKIGRLVEQKAGSQIGRLVSNPDTMPLAARALAKAGATGLGSAVEGAFYGLGQSASESLLGDPNNAAEKIAANVGLSGLLGGGLGGLLGAAGEVAKSPWAMKFVSEADKPKVDAGDFETIVKNSDHPQKEGILSGLSKLREDAPEIQRIAEENNLPVTPGQISDNNLVRQAADSLRSQPTKAGLRYQALERSGFDGANQIIDDTLGHYDSLSDTELGNKLKDSLTNKITKQKQAVNDLYRTVNEQYPMIPVDSGESNKVASDILKNPEIEALKRIDPNGPQYKFISDATDRIKNIRTVDDIKRVSTLIKDSATTPEMRRLGYMLSEHLGDFEGNALTKFASDNAGGMANPEKIQQLIAQRSAANEAYKPIINQVKQLAKGLGKKSVKGLAEAVDFIENINPQQISKKLLSEGNTQFSGWFANNFPEEFDAIKQNYLTKLRQSSINSEGYLDTRKILKALDKMQPETKGELFSSEQQQKFSDMKKYLSSFPSDFNPSHTAHEKSFREFFTPGSVLGTAVGLATGHSVLGTALGAIGSRAMANVRDAGIEHFINKAVQAGQSEESVVKRLGLLDRMSSKVTNKIENSARKIFSHDKDISGFVAPKLIPRQEKSQEDATETHERMVADLNDMVNNPEKLVENLSRSTEQLSDIAPDISAGLHFTTSRAMSFLQSKLPVQNPSTPLSSKFIPSPSDLSKFNRYHEVVENPLISLTQLKTNTLVPETIETLSNVYPQLYGEMKSSLMDKMSDFLVKHDSSEIPYQKKLALSMFLGQDMHDSLIQQNIASNQSAFGQNQIRNSIQNTPMKSSQAGLKNLSVADSYKTAKQASEQRGEA